MNDYKLYSRISDHETILELWGASTKHPDSMFKFSNFKKCEWVSPHCQIFQWILECASKLVWPVHAKDLCKFAFEVYECSSKIPLA
jgi:hypothetical protein